MDEFSSYIKSYEREVLEKIIENISNDFKEQDLNQQIKESIINEYINEIQDEKDSIIDKIVKDYISTITKEELLNAILQDEGIINRLESLSIDLINEKLTHINKRLCCRMFKRKG